MTKFTLFWLSCIYFESETSCVRGYMRTHALRVGLQHGHALWRLMLARVQALTCWYSGILFCIITTQQTTILVGRCFVGMFVAPLLLSYINAFNANPIIYCRCTVLILRDF